uniref:Uncharacterized protein n=1 Tax=Nicotiana tabacum TaxID=4097 RepID=A0A1S3X5E6_TOBAC|nr:PREDICTED: uncharacterized protein LOC107761385 [Nicotiana tabacum]
MADNGVNNTIKLEAQGNQPQHEDSISDICSEGNEATSVHGRRYPRHVREATPDDAERNTLLKRETLTKENLTRCSLLPEHFIDSFEMLVDSFIKAHVGDRKVQAWKPDIFRIAQGESELLQEFKLKESLLEFQATTWEDIHNRYESKIRIEDDQLGFPMSVKGREKNKEKLKDDFDTDRRSSRSRFLPYEWAEDCSRGFRSELRFVTDRRIDRGWNNSSLQEKEMSCSRDPSYPRLSEYNFNDSVVELLSAMRNIKEARFSKPMRSDPSQRDPNLYCEYHGTNGHRTGVCWHLSEEVATLLKNGHLKEFISDRSKNN